MVKYYIILFLFNFLIVLQTIVIVKVIVVIYFVSLLSIRIIPTSLNKLFIQYLNIFIKIQIHVIISFLVSVFEQNYLTCKYYKFTYKVSKESNETILTFRKRCLVDFIQNEAILTS